MTEPEVTTTQGELDRGLTTFSGEILTMDMHFSQVAYG